MALLYDELEPLLVVDHVSCLEVPPNNIPCDLAQSLTAELRPQLNQGELVLENLGARRSPVQREHTVALLLAFRLAAAQAPELLSGLRDNAE